jgi:hypothetical protein
MLSRRHLILTAGASLACATGASALPAIRPFSFSVFGCLPYRPEEMDDFDRLIDEVGRTSAFGIYVGDIKSGSTRCEDSVYQDIRRRVDRSRVPIVFTPGDNEWTDCHRQGDDPIERLAYLRNVFFDEPGQSLGRRKMRLETQPAIHPAHSAFVENATWAHGGVRFATLHIVGSNDNASVPAEQFARQDANLAWLDHCFETARNESAAAIVLAWQADVFVPPPSGQVSGFTVLLDRLRAHTEAFPGPVLVVHADSHHLALRRLADASGRETPGLMFMQVMGAQDLHGMRVMVDPRQAAVFAFTPMLVPGNARF